MANPIQLYGAQIKRAAPEVLQGEWFTDSLNTLAGMGDADLLDEGDSFTIDDFPRVKMPREADADWKLDIPSIDQHGETQDITKLPAIDGIILYSPQRAAVLAVGLWRRVNRPAELQVDRWRYRRRLAGR